MNFWNNPNPNTDSLKLVVILAIIVIGGFFAYKFAGPSGNFQPGSVFQGTKKVATEQVSFIESTNTDGSCTVKICTGANCVSFDGSQETIKGREFCRIEEDGDETPGAMLADVLKATLQGENWSHETINQ